MKRGVFVQTHRWKYQQATQAALAEMDRALSIVGGSFALAAKLLDVEPQRFRNLVNYHEALAKWQHSRRGRPVQEAVLTVEPFQDRARRAAWQGPVLVKQIIERLPQVDQEALFRWLATRFAGVATPIPA